MVIYFYLVAKIHKEKTGRNPKFGLAAIYLYSHPARQQTYKFIGVTEHVGLCNHRQGEERLSEI